MSDATSPVMITVAPTGARVSKNDNPATPITPREIAEEVANCAAAGAGIAHIHARDADGRPTQSIAVFREIVERIREKTDIVLQLSLGTRGFTVEQALEPISLDAEMASLPLAAFEKDDLAAQQQIIDMAARIKAHGVRPEMSVYNRPMLEGALRIIAGGAQAPFCIGLITGAPASLRAGAKDLIALVEQLPSGTHWWVAKGGTHQLGLRALAVELGGHVRVGFEDSPLEFRGRRPAKSNAALVERMASVCAALGRPVAAPSEVRSLLRFGRSKRTARRPCPQGTS